MRLWMICTGTMALLAIAASDASAQCSREIGAAKAKTLVSQCKKATAEGGQSGVCYALATRAKIFAAKSETPAEPTNSSKRDVQGREPYTNDMPEPAD